MMPFQEPTTPISAEQIRAVEGWCAKFFDFFFSMADSARERSQEELLDEYPHPENYQPEAPENESPLYGRIMELETVTKSTLAELKHTAAWDYAHTTSLGMRRKGEAPAATHRSDLSREEALERLSSLVFSFVEYLTHFTGYLPPDPAKVENPPPGDEPSHCAVTLHEQLMGLCASIPLFNGRYLGRQLYETPELETLAQTMEDARNGSYPMDEMPKPLRQQMLRVYSQIEAAMEALDTLIHQPIQIPGDFDRLKEEAIGLPVHITTLATLLEKVGTTETMTLSDTLKGISSDLQAKCEAFLELQALRQHSMKSAAAILTN